MNNCVRKYNFPIEIEENLHLKLIDLNEAKVMLKLINDNRTHLRSWMGWLDQNKTIKNTQAFIQTELQRFQDNECLPLNIYYHNRMIGRINADFEWKEKSMTIGYWLSKQSMGKGIITKSCSTLIENAFSQWHITSVIIRVAPENTKSVNVATKLGFTKIDYVKEAEWLYDHYVDWVVYKLNKD